MFKALLYETFKAYGVLLIDAQFESLRKVEAPMFKKILKKYQLLDDTFRATQKRTQNQSLKAMMQTDTNVHLFLHDENIRRLVSYDDKHLRLNKTGKEYMKGEIINTAESRPELFSSNVAIRPLMEEWLSNVAAFIGGPSRIKYQAELKDVFELLDVEMPVMMSKLRITYLDDRTEKLFSKYNTPLGKVSVDGVEGERSKFIRRQTSDQFIEKVEGMTEQQCRLHQDSLDEVTGNQNNISFVNKNNEIHIQQYDYLPKHYLLNIEGENDIGMKQFREVQETFHPAGGLQERIWSPLQVSNDFGVDAFKPSICPPPFHTLDHIIIKS